MRIAPPEAPKTGYNFGKGAYFADMIAKSGDYSCPYLSNGIGLMLLCQVALGTPAEREYPDSDVDDFVKSSQGRYHSCHGIGRRHPNPYESIKVVLKQGKGEEYEIPNGKIVNNDSA
jgi:poly [ADP-ribose] polymerase